MWREISATLPHRHSSAEAAVKGYADLAADTAVVLDRIDSVAVKASRAKSIAWESLDFYENSYLRKK